MNVYGAMKAFLTTCKAKFKIPPALAPKNHQPDTDSTQDLIGDDTTSEKPLLSDIPQTELSRSSTHPESIQPWADHGELITALPKLPEHPPLTAFTCFEKLPEELRIKIWNMAFPTRRFVIIQLEDVKFKQVKNSALPSIYGILSTPTPEAILPNSGNFEPAFFGTRRPVGLPGSISFDYATDVAFFSRGPKLKKSNPLDFIGKQDLKRIGQVAVEVNSPHFYSVLFILPSLIHLKRLFLICNDKDEFIDLNSSSKTFKSLPDKKMPNSNTTGTCLACLPADVREEITFRNHVKSAISAVRLSQVGMPRDEEKEIGWWPPNWAFGEETPPQRDVPFEIIVLSRPRPERVFDVPPKMLPISRGS